MSKRLIYIYIYIYFFFGGENWCYIPKVPLNVWQCVKVLSLLLLWAKAPFRYIVFSERPIPDIYGIVTCHGRSLQGFKYNEYMILYNWLLSPLHNFQTEVTFHHFTVSKVTGCQYQYTMRGVVWSMRWHAFDPVTCGCAVLVFTAYVRMPNSPHCTPLYIFNLHIWKRKRWTTLTEKLYPKWCSYSSYSCLVRHPIQT